ncbi:MAG: Undecaprenyl-phosphate alpha-N-acetylglucosaminyl 1-phosphate transferase, partial [uncultured Acidimicrobiales bacterium]
APDLRPGPGGGHGHHLAGHVRLAGVRLPPSVARRPARRPPDPRAEDPDRRGLRHVAGLSGGHGGGLAPAQARRAVRGQHRGPRRRPRGHDPVRRRPARRHPRRLTAGQAGRHRARCLGDGQPGRADAVLPGALLGHRGARPEHGLSHNRGVGGAGHRGRQPDRRARRPGRRGRPHRRPRLLPLRQPTGGRRPPHRRHHRPAPRRHRGRGVPGVPAPQLQPGE